MLRGAYEESPEKEARRFGGAEEIWPQENTKITKNWESLFAIFALQSGKVSHFVEEILFIWNSGNQE